MLPYIVLVIMQVSASLFFAPLVVPYINLQGDLRMFVYGVIFAVIIWLVGQIGGEVLKNIPRPSGTALTSAIIGGLIGAALLLIPGLLSYVPIKISVLYVPLAGAIIGYFVTK